MSAPALVSLSDALTRLKAEPELFVVYDRNAAWVAQKLIPALPVKASLEIETSEQVEILLICKVFSGAEPRQTKLLYTGKVEK